MTRLCGVTVRKCTVVVPGCTVRATEIVKQTHHPATQGWNKLQRGFQCSLCQVRWWSLQHKVVNKKEKSHVSTFHNQRCVSAIVSTRQRNMSETQFISAWSQWNSGSMLISGHIPLRINMLQRSSVVHHQPLFSLSHFLSLRERLKKQN